MKGNVYFDSYLRCKSGKVIPYYDVTFNVDSIEDQQLVWFHEGYGVMQLYRLHRVDETADFIAEALKARCRTSDDKWEIYLNNPELALIK